VVSLALFPNMLRALIGPVVDLTLTLRRWYGIGGVACSATVLLLGLLPIRTDTLALLGAAGFLSGVCSNLLLVPYAVLSSVGNAPISYMTALDGWAHNRFGAAGMLRLETAVGVGAVFLGLAAVRWVEGRERRDVLQHHGARVRVGASRTVGSGPPS
jgi:hypothetical protein